MSRGLCIAASALVAVGVGSHLYCKRGETRDARRYPPPGELVDIGGRRLHLCRAGEGTPSVVIVPCLGGPGSQWWAVQRQLARFTGVYTYDRGGLGWSDPAPWSRSYRHMADELHRLLSAADIPPPYVLVGHSTGGIIVRQFAVRHPRGLAGLVLVDSSHEDQLHRLAPFKASGGDRRTLWRRIIRAQCKPLGLIRIAQDLGFYQSPTGPVNVMAQMSRHRRADVQEMIYHSLALPHTKPPDLGDLPLLVITAGRRDPGGYADAWHDLQNELAALSTSSTHIVAERAGHHINRDDPDFVVQAVHDMVTKLGD